MTMDMKAAFTERLRREREAQGPKPTADGTLLRASAARSCARQMAFPVFGIEPVHELSDNSLRAFNRGSRLHDELQEIITDEWGGEVEVTASYRPLDLSVSGDGDGVYESPFGRVLAEIKSVKTFAYNLAVHGKGNPRWKNRAQEPGPKLEHVTQGGIYALSPQIQADYLHVIYINKEDDDIHDMPFHLDEEVPNSDGQTVRQLATNELDRMAGIERQIRDGILPERSIPGVGLVEDPPEHGAKKGQWQCRFCDWRDLCAAQPSGSIDMGVPPADLTDHEEAA